MTTKRSAQTAADEPKPPVSLDFQSVLNRLAQDFAAENANLRIQLAMVTAQLEQIRSQNGDADS